MMLGCAPVLSAADQGACFSRLVAAIDIGHSRASHPEIAGLNKAITGREGRCGRGRAD
jgi:hypothetical protein